MYKSIFSFLLMFVLFTGCNKADNPTEDNNDNGNTQPKTGTLDAKNDCKVLLNDVTTIVSGLQGGQNYTESISSNVSGTWMKGAFFLNSNADGSVSYRYVDNRSSFNFQPYSSGWQLAPFLVDMNSIYDNSGKVTITIQ